MMAAMSASFATAPDSRARRARSAHRSDAPKAHCANMATTALLVTSAAQARRESRGAHFRSDFPQAEALLAHRSRMTLAEAVKIEIEARAP